MKVRVKTDTWMPLYIGDYLRDTMFLRREHHGSYLLLIMAYWTNGGPLPSDDETLMEIAKCKIEDWAITKALLSRFFIVTDSAWRHERIDEELSRAAHLAQSLSERGKSGAEARWQKPNRNATANASAIATANAQAMLGDAPSPSPLSHTHTEHDAAIPTLQEVLSEADMRGLKRESAQSFFNHHQDNSLWINQFNRLIDWRSKLRSWATKDRTQKHEGNKRNNPQRIDRSIGTANEGAASEYAGLGNILRD